MAGRKNEIDERLVKLLGQDARQRSEALAKKLGVSAATVRRRVKRLIQNGLIRIVAVVDPAKFGFPLSAVIAFDVAHDKVEQATQALVNRSEIKWISTTTGRFDILVWAQFHSADDLSDFLQKEVSSVEGMRDTETFVCLHVDKGRYVQL
ncbi:MAG: Lrp/AsnC family transcriptional regulator [Chloroflexi bacterium]|nr:Lrp/AsnC family transcriptional regulator [Chloroflexota bacterium]